MSIAFARVNRAPLENFEASAPDACVIGIVGEDGSGVGELLRAGAAAPGAQLLGPQDVLQFDPSARTVLIDRTFAAHGWLAQAKACIELDRLRRAGATVLVASHDEELLRRISDEVWWISEGKLAGRGDPEEILAAYRKHCLSQLRSWGETSAALSSGLSPKMRRGDGRAQVTSVKLIGENGAETQVWRSGELAVVKIRVRFGAAVDDPVAGIMIRTRVGLNVYGTNTELARLKLGPRAAGDVIELTFAFRCELCPGDYTLTVASHDPDGVWHDWLEDAVAFSVGDDRYTAGVANLRAQVSVTSDPQ
jgi:lipopolysaccharide transport system ATP-binding protein